MSGRTRGRPRVEHPDAPSQEPSAGEQPPLQFATVQQVTVLQDQLSTMMEMLRKMAWSASYIGGVAGSRCPTSCGNLPGTNWESILNDKVEEAIAWRKSRVRPISIKEDPFKEDVMTAPLPLKFKEPTGEFDGTGDPIDHIRTFQDWVRLHGWPDAIACKAFPMILRKDAREWFDTLPSRLISSFVDFANKFAIYFSSSTRKKKTTMGLMQVTQDEGESLHEYMSRFNRATLGIKNLQMSSVITVLLSGLRNHSFRASLFEKASQVNDRITQARRRVHRPGGDIESNTM
ncbi:Uncharacterized protein Adt_22690 [Abeliophyllum distichum]|uniref:Retrotransposon gag domain-containing protein n=1 Tax=Abeliophyllum distichum TaxID=126358 RepID=A0ABD1S8T9_9LAMI